MCRWAHLVQTALVDALLRMHAILLGQKEEWRHLRRQSLLAEGFEDARKGVPFAEEADAADLHWELPDTSELRAHDQLPGQESWGAASEGLPYASALGIEGEAADRLPMAEEVLFELPASPAGVGAHPDASDAVRSSSSSAASGAFRLDELLGGAVEPSRSRSLQQPTLIAATASKTLVPCSTRRSSRSSGLAGVGAQAASSSVPSASSPERWC